MREWFDERDVSADLLGSIAILSQRSPITNRGCEKGVVRGIVTSSCRRCRRPAMALMDQHDMCHQAWLRVLSLFICHFKSRVHTDHLTFFDGARGISGANRRI